MAKKNIDDGTTERDQATTSNVADAPVAEKPAVKPEPILWNNALKTFATLATEATRNDLVVCEIYGNFIGAPPAYKSPSGVGARVIPSDKFYVRFNDGSTKNYKV